MLKHPIKRLSLFIVIGVILLTILACRRNEAPVEREKYFETRSYSFDPETILESLAQGNTHVFTLLLATPEVMPPNSIATIQWSQEDYYRIAQAIHDRSWGESLGNNNLFNISFDMNCADIERGTFTEASFDSFKVIQEGEEEIRIEHWIRISLVNNLVNTYDIEYQPNSRNKKPIDLERFTITADEGLQIAEKNGGFEARMRVDNDCEVSAFAPTVNGGGWQISYINYPDNFVHSLYRIAIDPRTGEYEILNPNP